MTNKASLIIFIVTTMTLVTIPAAWSQTAPYPGAERKMSSSGTNPAPSKAQVDVAMATLRYQPAAISAFPHFVGEADALETVTVPLQRGHWAIAALPMSGGCRLSVTYRVSANNALTGGKEVAADTSLGFSMVRVDIAVNAGLVEFKISAEPPGRACLYRLELYSQRYPSWSSGDAPSRKAVPLSVDWFTGN